jgi:hypothetical protein
MIMVSTSTSPAALRAADQFGLEADDAMQSDQHGEAAKSRLDKILGRLPNVLSSKPVILFGILLFLYLFVFAGLASLLGHSGLVSANTQLILGNYTNVSSSVGAGIAAGASLTLVKRQRRAHKVAVAAHEAAMEARAFAIETHRLLHTAMPEHAAALGQVPGRLSPASAQPPAPAQPAPAQPAPASPAPASSAPGPSAPGPSAPGPGAPPAPGATPDPGPPAS